MKRGRPAMASSQPEKKRAKKAKKLFVEVGKALSFYVPPCQDAAQLRSLVRDGGGLIVDKPGDYVINIIPQGAPAATEHVGVSSRFITDSAAKGQLQKVRRYIIQPAKAAPAKAAPASAANAAGVARAGDAFPEAKVRAERKKFTEEDDNALTKWVKSNPGLRPQGREIWERAQRAKITKHSWQSMQNRFRRRIADKKMLEKPGQLALALEREKEAAEDPKPAKRMAAKPQRKRRRSQPVADKDGQEGQESNAGGWPRDPFWGVPFWLRKTQKAKGPFPDLADL